MHSISLLFSVFCLFFQLCAQGSAHDVSPHCINNAVWPHRIKKQEKKIADVQAEKYALEFKNPEVARCDPSLYAHALTEQLAYKNPLNRYGQFHETLDADYAADVKKWCKLHNKEQRIIQRTQRQIKEAGIWSSALAEQDKYGKTALDYCKTQAIYDTLRDHGAPFQWNAFLYINRYKIAASAAITAMTATCFFWMRSDGSKPL